MVATCRSGYFKAFDTINSAQIRRCLVEVYEGLGMADYLPILKEYLLNNATEVNKITDSKGY